MEVRDEGRGLSEENQAKIASGRVGNNPSESRNVVRLRGAMDCLPTGVTNGRIAQLSKMLKDNENGENKDGNRNSHRV
jgi:hypothetical protein